jgi:hypothetical protein
MMLPQKLQDGASPMSTMSRSASAAWDDPMAGGRPALTSPISAVGN